MKPRFNLPSPRRDQCRYIIGNPGHKDTRWCENDKRHRSSFCEEHHKVCWVQHTWNKLEPSAPTETDQTSEPDSKTEQEVQANRS